MILRIYSLYDATAQDYYPPSYARSDAEYTRSLLYQLKDPQSGIIGSYPGDFKVAYLGDFDSATGSIFLRDPVWIVSNVADLLIGGDSNA